jgi:hypothetical protein
MPLLILPHLQSATSATLVIAPDGLTRVLAPVEVSEEESIGDLIPYNAEKVKNGDSSMQTGSYLIDEESEEEGDDMYVGSEMRLSLVDD